MTAAEKLVDVSHHNTDAGPIDWATAQEHIGGVYMKITEGLTLVDPAWQSDYAGAGGQHIPRGAYHFADGNDPAAEANHFADQLMLHSWELVPTLDIESSWAKPAWLRSFRSQFRKRMAAAGRSGKLRVYSSFTLLTGVLDPIGWIDSDTTIWAARYARALGWNHPQLVLWQNTSTAHLAGFVGSVDEDQYMNGWTPAADQGGKPPVTTPAPLTADQTTAATVEKVYQRSNPDYTQTTAFTGDVTLRAMAERFDNAMRQIINQLAANAAAIDALATQFVNQGPVVPGSTIPISGSMTFGSPTTNPTTVTPQEES